MKKERGLLEYELRNNGMYRALRGEFADLLREDGLVLLLPQSAALEGVEVSRAFCAAHVARPEDARSLVAGQGNRLLLSEARDQVWEKKRRAPPLLVFNPFGLEEEGRSDAAAQEAPEDAWDDEDPIIVLREAPVDGVGLVLLLHRPLAAPEGGAWPMHPTSSGTGGTAPQGDGGLAWLFSGGLASKSTSGGEEVREDGVLSPVPSEAEEEEDLSRKETSSKEKKRMEDAERKRLRDLFFERMKKPKARELSRRVQAFVTAQSDPATLVTPETVRSFLDDMQQRVLSHPLWTSGGKRGSTRVIPQMEVEETAEALERFVCCKLYSRLFAPSASALEADRAFNLRVERLQFIKPKHLDIDVDENVRGVARLMAVIVRELRAINNFRAPRDKMICCLNACNALWKVMDKLSQEKGRAMGADEFLPHLVYAVLRANPPHLPSNLEYVQNYRSPSKQQQEAGYYWIQLASTVPFLTHMGPHSLTIEPELYYRYSGDEPPEHQEQEQEDVESEEAGGETSVTLDQQGEEDNDEESEREERQFTFLDRSVDSLTMQEVPMLLREYKEMARRLKKR